MPMMAVYEQNDALSSARLLASTTLEELRGGEEVDETVVVNMFRLIDGYRSHGFYGLEDDDDGSGDDFGGSSMLRSGERRLGDVRAALDRTVAAFGGDGDERLDEIERVLRALAYPNAAQSDAAARERTETFLTSLISNLRRISV